MQKKCIIQLAVSYDLTVFKKPLMAKSFFILFIIFICMGLTNSDMTFKGLCVAEQLERNGNSAKGTTDCEQLAFSVSITSNIIRNYPWISSSRAIILPVLSILFINAWLQTQ